MLVLTRKLNEELTIVLGDERVVIRVNQLHAARVRLGITASPEVQILRGDAIRREPRPRPAAAQSHCESPPLPDRADHAGAATRKAVA